MAEAGTSFEEFVTKLGSDRKLQGFIARTAQGGIDLQQTLLRLRATFGDIPKAELGLRLGQFGFSERSAGGIAELMDKMNEWQSIQKDLQNSSGEAARLAALRMSATDEQLTVLNNNFRNLRESLGAALLPAIQAIIPQFVSLIQRATEFAKAHQGLARVALTIAAIAAGALALGAVLSFAAAGFVGLGGAISGLFSAIMFISRLGLVTQAWAAAQWLVNAAMAANPVGAVIVGIAALIAIGYAVYEHFGALKEFFKSWGPAIAGFIVAPFAMIPLEIIKHLGQIKDAAKNIAHGIASYFVGHSPIPEGPLHEMDLAREISRSMAPSQIVAAARRAAAAVALSMPLLMSPGAAVASATPASTGAPVVNIHQEFHLSGGTPADKKALQKAIEESGHELVRTINRELAKRERRSF